MRKVAFLASCLLVVGWTAGAQSTAPGERATAQADLYVATDGNDAWSGHLPEPNPAHTDGPVATLGAARDKLRALKHAVPPADTRDLLVMIRGGTYLLDRAVVFGIEDAAPGDFTITYAAFPGEIPVFSSAVPVTQWSRATAEPPGLPIAAHGQIWVAPLPEGLGRFHSLYDAVGLLPRARTALFLPTPIEPPRDLALSGLEDDQARPATHREPPAYPANRAFYYPEGALHRWANPEDIEIYSRSRNWTVNLLPLQSVDERLRLATTALPGTYPIEPRDGKPSVAVENVPEGLTGPGRWCLDTVERKVYLWPRQDGEPHDIAAPRLRELIRVEGTVDVNGPTDLPVKGLQFRGLTLTMGDRDVWTDHDAGIQHDWEMLDKPDALIRFRGALRCAVEDCRLTQSGGAGVRFDLFAQECRVTGTEVSHLGQGGILFLGYGPGTKDVNHDNLVLDCDVHDCGEILPHSHGIILYQSGSNRVAYNDLHDLPRKAVCITGVRLGGYKNRVNPPREFSRSIRWWEIPTPPVVWKDVLPYTHSRNNRVEYNRAERCVRELSDGSVMNVSGAGEGNTFFRNYIKNTFSPPGEGASAVFRTDDDQTGSLFEENVVAHANVYGYEHKRQNRFVNNILLDVSPRGFIRWWRQFGPLGQSEFEHNILVDVRGDAIFYRKASVIRDLGVADIDHNVYWRVQDPSERAAARGYATGYMTGDPFGLELAALRALGHDLHSQEADPLLMDWRNEDYRLRPDSPAHALGIKSIDVREMGRRGLHH